MIAYVYYLHMIIPNGHKSREIIVRFKEKKVINTSNCD